MTNIQGPLLTFLDEGCAAGIANKDGKFAEGNLPAVNRHVAHTSRRFTVDEYGHRSLHNGIRRAYTKTLIAYRSGWPAANENIGRSAHDRTACVRHRGHSGRDHRAGVQVADASGWLSHVAVGQGVEQN